MAKPAKLHTVHEILAAYTLFYIGCQTYLWVHIPQDGPVHAPGASNDGPHCHEQCFTGGLESPTDTAVLLLGAGDMALPWAE